MRDAIPPKELARLSKVSKALRDYLDAMERAGRPKPPVVHVRTADYELLKKRDLLVIRDVPIKPYNHTK